MSWPGPALRLAVLAGWQRASATTTWALIPTGAGWGTKHHPPSSTLFSFQPGAPPGGLCRRQDSGTPPVRGRARAGLGARPGQPLTAARPPTLEDSVPSSTPPHPRRPLPTALPKQDPGQCSAGSPAGAAARAAAAGAAPGARRHAAAHRRCRSPQAGRPPHTPCAAQPGGGAGSRGGGRGQPGGPSHASGGAGQRRAGPGRCAAGAGGRGPPRLAAQSGGSGCGARRGCLSQHPGGWWLSGRGGAQQRGVLVPGGSAARLRCWPTTPLAPLLPTCRPSRLPVATC